MIGLLFFVHFFLVTEVQSVPRNTCKKNNLLVGNSNLVFSIQFVAWYTVSDVIFDLFSSALNISIKYK